MGFFSSFSTFGQMGGTRQSAAPPVITTTSLPSGTEGEAYSQQLAATGQVTSWSLASGTLPAGLTLSSGGLLAGTPDADQAGTFNFTARATGPGGFDDQALSLELAAASSPPDPAGYTAYYDAQDDGVTKTGALIDSYVSKGSVGVDCVMQAFGTRNTQDAIVRPLDTYPTSLSAALSDDNWYRSASNASDIIAEGAGFFVFAFYATGVTTRQTLWALENGTQGRIALVDSGGGVIKVRAILGSGGQQVTTDSTAVTLNQWNYATVRYTGQTVRVKLNTAAEQSVTGAGGDVLATRLGQRFQILADGATELFEGSAAVVAIRATYPDDTELAAVAALFKAKYASLPI